MADSLCHCWHAAAGADVHLLAADRPKMSCCRGSNCLISRPVQVLLSICSLLTDPNPDDPLVPEIAHIYKTGACFCVLMVLEGSRWLVLVENLLPAGARDCTSTHSLAVPETAHVCKTAASLALALAC